MKAIKKTISDLESVVQGIEKKLQIECPICKGTGSPKTKTGNLPKSGKGTAKCKDCGGTGLQGDRINTIETNILSIKKDIKRIGDNLNAYINRQYTEIRVLPKGHNPSLQGGASKIKWENGWEDYSGDFYINSDEKKDAVIKKAKEHFHTYFECGTYHRNKKLGLFLSSARSGKKLIQEFTTD